MILYGLFGIGKILIVSVIVGSIKYVFCILNVVINNKKDMEVVVVEVKMSGMVIFFLDEVYWLDKVK